MNVYTSFPNLTLSDSEEDEASPNESPVAPNDASPSDAADQEASSPSSSASKAEISDPMAVLAHELRTPLTTIIGMAEAIESDPDVAARFAPLIRQSGQQLHRLINALLNLSKLDAGAKVLSCEWADVLDVVRHATDALIYDASEKGLTLRTDLHPRPVVAYVDPVAIRQIVTNLVSNAIQHSREGTVHVAVRSLTRSVQIVVTDDGPGIPPEIHDHLFDPFVSRASRTDASQSTGLGLAITWHLVNQMGGTIDVQSEPGDGARFTVCLPRSPHYRSALSGSSPTTPSPSRPDRSTTSSPPSKAVDGTIETLIDRLSDLQM